MAALLCPAGAGEFEEIRSFYWNAIDLMAGREDTVGWKKGIYPSDDFLRESMENGEMFLIRSGGRITSAVVLNSRWNEGYEGIPWGADCAREEILVPHALAVDPRLQGRGLGRAMVEDIIRMARKRGIKTIRLDILNGNTAAERLYTGAGFTFVAEKEMFYPDTGLTAFSMYELIL